MTGFRVIHMWYILTYNFKLQFLLVSMGDHICVVRSHIFDRVYFLSFLLLLFMIFFLAHRNSMIKFDRITYNTDTNITIYDMYLNQCGVVYRVHTYSTEMKKIKKRPYGVSSVKAFLYGGNGNSTHVIYHVCQILKCGPRNVDQWIQETRRTSWTLSCDAGAKVSSVVSGRF